MLNACPFCQTYRFLAASQVPALLSIQEPVLTKFHYSHGCPCANEDIAALKLEA